MRANADRSPPDERRMRLRKYQVTTATRGRMAEGEQRQPPVERKHDHHDHDQRDALDQDGDDAVGEDGVEGVDVAGQARHQFAGRRAVEKGRILGQNLVEEAHAQVGQGALACMLQEIGEAVGQDKDTQGGESVEQREPDQAGHIFARRWGHRWHAATTAAAPR